MSRSGKIKKAGRLDQRGLASIVIVTVLVVLLSLISIGFARLMGRAVNTSLNNQLSSSAGYAAQSALNDTIAYVEVNTGARSTTCNGLFTTNGVTKGINPTYVSGDTAYKYSCILVNPTPPSLEYGIPASQSQVATINTVSSGGATVTPGNLLISWQASGSDISKNNTSNCSSSLYDEGTWSTKNCPPLLRIALYPVDGSGNVSQANSRTFFLYPTNTGGNTLDYTSKADGSLVPVNCTTQPSTPNESSDNNQCSVVISNFSAASGLSYFYTRLTPLYDQADILIKSNDSGNSQLLFKGDQSLIDVTAQVGSSSKRLQSRVAIDNTTDITPSQALSMPENSLRTAEAICKRLDVSAGAVTNQGTFCPGTQQTIIPPNPPVVHLCGSTGSCDPDTTTSPQTISIADSGSANLYWDVTSDPLSGTATCNTTGSSLPWNGPSGTGTGNSNTGGLSGDPSGQTYTYTVNCTNGSGIPASATVNVNVGAPPNDPGVGSFPPVLPGTGSTPGSPGCDDIIVNVGWDGIPGDGYSGSVSGTDGNICGIGISQCNSFNAGGGSLEEDDFGNSGDAEGTSNPGTGGGGYIGCLAINGVWGYSQGSSPGGGSSSTPSVGWVSRGISYYGVKGGEVSRGISSWCNDSDASHLYLVCGVYVTTNINSCSLFWISNGNRFQENQYNGIVNTTNRESPIQGVFNSVSPPGFVLGFPGSDYVITNGQAPQLEVDCTNGISSWIWSPASYPTN